MINPNTPIRQPWQPKVDNIITQHEFRGVNTLDPFSIDPAYAMSVKNLTSAKYPAATTRPGYSVLKQQGTKVIGLAAWKDDELHAIFDDGTWWKYDGSTWTQLTSGLSTAAEWSFCNFRGNFDDINLIAANGIGVPRRYDGSTVTTLSGAPSGLNYIEQHDNRLYGAVGNTLHFSELSVPTNWTQTMGSDSDPGQIVVETPNGEEINGLLAGAGHIIIYKPSYQAELYGTSPSDYRKIDVADDIGLANHRSKVVLNGVVYQMDRNGIYSYLGGARPDKRFSLVIQKYIDELSEADLAKCCMGTDGQRLYTYIPDKILEYDPKFGTWYVWEGISAAHFARVGDSFYVGDTKGRVLRFGGSTDAGEPIKGEWVSKPFTAESMSQVIRWLRAWVTANVPAGSSINVYMSKTVDGDDWILVGNTQNNAGIVNKPIYLRSQTLPNAKMLRIKIEFTGPVDIHEIAREEEHMPIR